MVSRSKRFREKHRGFKMTDKASRKNGNNGSVCLLLGILMLILSVILAVVFYDQTETGWTPAPSMVPVQGSVSGNKSEEPKSETEQEHLEQIKREAMVKINDLQRDAAQEFQEAASGHEQAVRTALRTVVIQAIGEAHRKVPQYADWLIGWEATWDMAKAWWDENLDTFLSQAAEKNLISQKELQNRLQVESQRLALEAGSKGAEIAIRYENRFASLLAGLDEHVRVQMPTLQLNSVTKANMSNPVITGNMAGISSFIGSSLLANYGERRFVKWIGEQVTIKAGSKVVRVGSGPIGWAISLGGGYLVEKGVDEYYIKPRLEEELNSQLNQLQTGLLDHAFIQEAATAQALPLRTIATEIMGRVQ
jgi:hypothetical protein